MHWFARFSLPFLLLLTCARAEHYRVFVLTGQSNSLGTTNGMETDVSPGADAADSRLRFFWHNVADATTSIGSSGGTFTTLQAQQGGVYPGSATHWGPEIGFGRALSRAGVENIAIVKASRGGGGNTHWSKTNGGHMYAHLVATVNAAASVLTGEGHTFEISGMLYLQGESDNAAEADLAGTRLIELVDNLRADLPNAGSMKAFVAGIAAAGANRDLTRARQEAAATTSPLVHYSSNLDLQAAVTDGLHFDKAAKLRIGERLAMAVFGEGVLARRYGKLVFIGDSITQGGNGDRPGYRYQVFRRLAENAVPDDPSTGYRFTGSVTGPQTTPVLTTPDVAGQVFRNEHDGHYGWRASWINGRTRLPANRRSNNRGEGTLRNWIGLAVPQTYDISGPDATVPYPDPAATGTGNTGTTYVPDTVVIMAGINDLGDNPLSANQVIADLGLMIDQLRAANPAVRIHLCQLLYTNQTAAMRTGVDEVNGQLPALAAAKNTGAPGSPVWVVPTNGGFDPVAMTYDNVHPNAAGEVFVGDRVAAGLGIIESPAAAVASPPPHREQPQSSFAHRFEGNEIWNGTAMVNGWTQTGTLTRVLPAPTDLRISHPGTDGRWIEGTGAGWSGIAGGSWTMEARVLCHANANGIILWMGTGSRRILVEVHGNRTQDHADGGQTFNSTHDNLDGAFHVFRVVHDAANARYHVFRDGARLTSLAGVPYDQTAADSRLIIGDFTSAVFGNNFDVTIDRIAFTGGAWLPEGLDSDGNGMTDAWEYEYFSTLTGTNPQGDPDEDGRDNETEFDHGTNPIVADLPPATLPVFVLAGGGNARGKPMTTTAGAPAPGDHPAEMPGGILLHDGTTWSPLSSAPDGSHGPEIGFARLLWDAGYREFGIIKATRTGGGNSLWDKGSADDSAYDDLVAAVNAAALSPPPGYGGIECRALLYVQGEDNNGSEADASGTRFAALLDNLRLDLPAASTIGGIIGETGGSGTNRDTTRARHLALANARADIGYAESTGTTTHNLDGLSVHYDADSLHLLGARLAAEAIAADALAGKPLPSWSNLHAWYMADHGHARDTAGAVVRLGDLRDGSATRDLSRRVAGQVFSRDIITGDGQTRRALRFDGTNDLWANATTEFGAISGPRTVAILARLTGTGDGYLFDGSTQTGRTRAQVRGGQWQAGITPSGTGTVWNGAEPATVAAGPGIWQRHVFVFTPNGTGGTSVDHWINGGLAGSATDNGTTNLGGLILGSNGGSPFSRLQADIAEVAVFASAFGATEVAVLENLWGNRWGAITAPPVGARVTQSPGTIPRFGRHSLLRIELEGSGQGVNALARIRIQIKGETRARAARFLLLGGVGSPVFSPSSPVLAEITGPGSDTLDFLVNVPADEGTRHVHLAIEPLRHAALGSTLDARVVELELTGPGGGILVPETPDPSGELVLGLVPLFNDVRTSGEGGINTYRIPGIVCDTNGVLHAVYDHRYAGGADLPANVDVGYSRSLDGGATWSPSAVIMDFDASVPGSSGNGVGDPCILHDPITDTLWVAALWSFGNNGWNGSGAGTTPAETGQYVLAKSEDGGLTWSAPINITVAVKDNPNWRLIFQGPGHGLAMRDGTLVFPSQYRDAAGVARVCSVFSTDHGATWDFGSGIPVSSPQTNENTVCELDDGRLLFSMRTPGGSNGQRAFAHFTPGGTAPMRDGTWGGLYRLPAVPDPVCQASIIQWTSRLRGHPREFLLHVGPGTSASRTNLTARISPDGGASWPVSRSIYGGPSAYSSICILPDQSLGILFEKDNYTRITFARVEREWLMNPEADADADGLPDTWELLHGTNPGAADGPADPDGDGAGNLLEYLAGTDPGDAGSRLRALSLAGGPSGWTFTWASVPGRTYAIETSESMETWTWVAIHLAGGTQSEHVLAPAGHGRLFVRARILP